MNKFFSSRGSKACTVRERVDNLKRRVSPVEFYSDLQQTSLASNKSGWTDAGLCPFHDDKKAGNFRVNAETGSFVCFACGTRGPDIIAYVRQHFGLGFWAALRWLEREWGARS